MRMKDVLARTGLTDRAVRLYIENGLISPKQESSYTGRKSILFSEEDVEMLEVVATLRRAGFSLSDIRRMQTVPDSAAQVLEMHRQSLAEEITRKQEILRKLSDISSDAPLSCRAIADGICASASFQNIPKEDSAMFMEDLKGILRRRTPSLLALIFLIVGLAVLIPLALRAAFCTTDAFSGGEMMLFYRFSWNALWEHFGVFAAVILLAVGAVCMLIYLVGGKKIWQIVSLALCVGAMLCLLLLPAAVRERLFWFEFLGYRFSFMRSLFYATHRWFDLFIRTLKYVPLLIASCLTAIGIRKEESL